MKIRQSYFLVFGGRVTPLRAAQSLGVSSVTFNGTNWWNRLIDFLDHRYPFRNPTQYDPLYCHLTKKERNILIFLPTQPNCSATPLPRKKKEKFNRPPFLANSLEICFTCLVLIVRWISEYNLKSSVFEINISIQLIVTYLTNQCLELCFRSVRTREAILAINCSRKVNLNTECIPFVSNVLRDLFPKRSCFF